MNSAPAGCLTLPAPATYVARTDDARRDRSLRAAEDIRLRVRRMRPEPLAYGRVLYEGTLYVIVPHHSQPFVDLDELCLHCVDRVGHSRYGTFGRPTWYGSLDVDTAIAEACHHALVESTDEGDEATPFGLYRVHVRGRFADLYGRELVRPAIIGEDYGPTQSLASAVRRAHLCGVLYPSARSSGARLAVFARKALRRARFVDIVSIRRVAEDAVHVRGPGTVGGSFTWREDLRRFPSTRLAYA